MRISVISFNGAPPARPLAYDFDSRGGAIGREEGNELTLPDPERHISRVQARIEFDGASFVFVDMGANPSSVNDRPVGKGNRVVLAGGERLAIGGYVLEAEFDHAAPVFSTPTVVASGDDPLGLFGGAPSASPLFADPFAAPAGTPSTPPPAAGDDPFAVFLASARPAPVVAPAEAAHDPFAPPPSAPPPARVDVMGLGAGRESSVDALFGLDGGAAPDPFFGTPLGEPAPSAAPAAPEVVDPLALFGGPAAPSSGAAPQRDDAPLLNQAFTPPRAEIPAGAELTQVVAPRPAGPRADDAAPAAPGAMVFSWDKAPPAASAPAAAAEVPPAPAARVEVSAERVDAAVPQSLPAVQPAAPAGHGVLMEAFLLGLGVPVRLPAELTPELMEQIGVMLREATQGTLELLTARALTKREVRAEVTMIVSKGNNPLKFSPDVGFALSQLLAPQGRGFMPPQEAMRDAYDDLRAHQFGFMAGMRAALAGVLKRFEPEALEQRVAARSVLDNLLPGSRKARLWDLFEQMYGEISQEAEDDFHALFGREFLRAYEEQVERLQAEREPDR